jgi:hypothetical protein
VVCGTQIGLKDYSLVATAAGSGKTGSNVPVFTDFTYYSPENIKSILKKALREKVFDAIQTNAPRLLELACFVLQGRARFIAAFLLSLYESTVTIGNEEGDLENADLIVDKFHKTLILYYAECTKAVNKDGFSLYLFWQKYFETSIQNYGPDGQPYLVREMLVDMAMDYLLQTSEKKRYDQADLVDTALVRLHREGKEYFYTIAEPLSIVAGLKFMNSIDPHPLIKRLVNYCFNTSNLENPQSIGKRVELIVAIRCLQGWWREIDTASEDVKKLFPQWALEAFKELQPPQVIVNQSKAVASDWVGKNFSAKQSSIFVLPDDNCGPDGIFAFMSFNCKTSQSNNVSSGECAKNFSKTEISNWCKKMPDRLENLQRLISSCQWPGIVHFLIEIPRSNPQDGREFITSDTSTTIKVNLNSEIARLILGKLFVERWRAMEESKK